MSALSRRLALAREPLFVWIYVSIGVPYDHRRVGGAHWKALATPSLGACLAPLSVCIAVAAAVADFDAPPAEEARIEGPSAWPKQRKRSGERCEQHVETRISGVEDPLQRGVNRRERANDRRPQTHDQEHTHRSAENVKRDRGGRQSGGQRSDAVKQQRAACGHAHEQKPGAGGTMGERREESSHASSLQTARRRRKPRKSEDTCPFRFRPSGRGDRGGVTLA